MPTEQAAPARIKHKVFTYRTDLEWLGNRAGMMRSEGKLALRLASPPEFKGESGVWTPEDLFVAAVSACTMTTFLALAEQAGLPLVSYTCRAEGILEFVGGGYRMTRVTLRPEIGMEAEDSVAKAAALLHKAHQRCIIANSIHSAVLIEPSIRAAGRTRVD